MSRTPTEDIARGRRAIAVAHQRGIDTSAWEHFLAVWSVRRLSSLGPVGTLHVGNSYIFLSCVSMTPFAGGRIQEILSLAGLQPSSLLLRLGVSWTA